MTLDDFLNLDEEHEIAASQTENLNRELSRATIKDIPENKRERVSEYILCALKMEAVSSDIRPSLEKLLSSLEEAIRQ